MCQVSKIQEKGHREFWKCLMNKTKHGIVSSSSKDQNVKGEMQWVLDFEI